ncbi:TPA: DUF3265 domain-containing protein [Vibrio vulnificus]|nr:DUF3265 domain-containing protein [Vibrio vulnificus]
MTNGSRGTANAWHYYYALVCVISVFFETFVVSWLPLNRALCAF